MTFFVRLLHICATVTDKLVTSQQNWWVGLLADLLRRRWWPTPPPDKACSILFGNVLVVPTPLLRQSLGPIFRRGPVRRLGQSAAVVAYESRAIVTAAAPRWGDNVLGA
jgi:hypothetical protein